MASNSPLDNAQSSTAAPSIDKVILDTVVPPSSKLDADQYMVNDLDGATESLSGSGNLNYQLLQSQMLADQVGTSAPFSFGRNAGDIYGPASRSAAHLPTMGPNETNMSGNHNMGQDDGSDSRFAQTGAYQSEGQPALFSSEMGSNAPMSIAAFDNMNSVSTATDTSSNSSIDSHDTTTTINTVNNTTNNTTNTTTNNYYEQTTINNGGNTTINYGDTINEGGGGGGGDITNLIETIINNTTDIVEDVTHSLTEIVNNLGDNITDIVGDTTNVLGDVTDIVGDTLNIVDESILQPVFDTVDNIVDTAVTPLLGDVTNIVGDTLNTVNESLLQPVFDTVDNVVDTAVTPLLDNVTTIVTDLTGGLGGELPDVTQPVVATVTDVLSEVAPNIIDGVESAFNEVVDAAVGPILGGVDDVLSNIPVVSQVTDALLNTDNLAGNPLIELGGTASGDGDIVTSGDLGDIATALLGGAGNIDINGVEDLAGDIDLGLDISQGLLGDGGAAVETADDLSLNLDLDILGHDLVTDGIGLNLDPLEQIIGDIDIDLNLGTNVLGDVADALLNAEPGGADTLLSPLGNILGAAGGQILTGIDSGNDQSLFVDDQTLNHLVDNLANDPGAALEGLAGDLQAGVSTLVETVTNADAGETLSNVTDIVNSVIGEVNLLDSNTIGAIADITGGGAEAPLAGLIDAASSVAESPWIEPLTSTVSDILSSPVNDLAAALPEPIGGVLDGLGDLLGGGNSGGHDGGGGGHGGLLRGLFG